MTTIEEWDRVFELTVPLLGASIGVLSVVGVLALWTLRPPGQRISYDGQYLVSVRYPGQWHLLTDFIQPNNPDVLALYSQIGPDPW
ncbi:unnamed protein product, partial [marine sediment metagenome]